MEMHLLFLDFETFYSAEYSLRKMPTPNYILDPRFEVVMLGAVSVVNGDLIDDLIDGPDVSDFIKLLDPKKTVTVTHNALFDNSILAWRYGFVPALMLDTMGMARALLGHKLKSFALGAVAEHLAVGKKNNAALMKVRGMTRHEIKKAGLYRQLAQYCIEDTENCAKIFLKLINDFPSSERQIMDLVLRCTIEPQLVLDGALLTRHLANVRAQKKASLEAAGVDRKVLMSTARFAAALEELGVEIETKVGPTGNDIPAFAKTDQFMEELCDHDDDRVAALAHARLGLRSTIEETRCVKLLSIANLTNDGRLPVPLVYGGAHTHRLSGGWGMNMQNLPRGSQLRHAIKAPNGRAIITADQAQIECRLLATVSGCNELIKQFSKGEDVYASFASQVFGRPITKKSEPHGPDGTSMHRFVGKTAVLGLGYGCGAPKFYNMVVRNARLFGMDLSRVNFTEDTAEQTVRTFRRTYPEIQQGWYKLDGVIIHAIANGCEMTWGPMKFQPGTAFLPGYLPLHYHDIKFEEGEWWFRYGKKRSKLYGGKLCENIIQYLARNVIMPAALRLASRGLRFAMQVHDELVFTVPMDTADHTRQLFRDELLKPPSWLPLVPLGVDVSAPSLSYGEAK